MHPIVRAALLLCPPEFRRQYGHQVADDAARDGEPPFRTAFDIARTGVSLRVEGVLRDVILAVRSLAKSPLYTTIALVTITVAIAANVAVASAIDAVVLAPFPYANSAQLAFVRLEGSPYGSLSYLDARDLASHSSTLSGVAIWGNEGLALTGYGAPRMLDGARVNAEYLTILGAKAELGRLLVSADASKPTIVLSDALWRSAFAADPSAVGRVLRLDGKDYVVAGVLAPGFANPLPGNLQPASFWHAVDPRSILGRSRIWRSFFAVARLRDGVTLAQAQADARRVVGSLVRERPSSYAGVRGVAMSPLASTIVGPSAPLLWLVDLAVVIVLAIACANVANLTIVRNAARERELVLRTALGASRRRLLSQLGTEAAILAAGGGAAGLLLGALLLRAFSATASGLIPRWEGVAVDVRVVLYIVVLLAVTVLLAGVLPAWNGQRELAASLGQRGRGSDRSARRLSAALVSVEIALAITVVACAALVLKSFVTLTNVDVGFNGRNVTLLNVALPSSYYESDERLIRYVNRLQRELGRIPGVRSVALANLAPFSGDFYPHAFGIPGKADPHATVDVNVIAGDYFRALGIPIVRGRSLDRRDTATSQPVVLVNAAFAMRYFGTLDALGKRVAIVSFTKDRVPPSTIVGVAGDTRDSFAASPRPQAFVPFAQTIYASRFIVRTDGNDAGLHRAIVAAAARAGPDVAPPQIVSYAELFAQDTLRSHVAVLLFGTLAAIALVLAFAGVYAVAAYSVTRQTTEIGIRRALGARAGDVLRSILWAALFQAACGIALGMVVIALSARLLASMLFETSPFDGPTLVVVALLLAACCTIAALVPAARATRIEPTAALRYE